MRAYLRTRMPDRRHADAESVSALVNQLSQLGYRTIGQIDEILDRTAVAFEAYEQRRDPVDAGRFWDVAVVKISVSIVDDEFNALRMRATPDQIQPIEKKYKDLVKPKLN
jgi:hypothetical protein